jgi:hypothetical protein
MTEGCIDTAMAALDRALEDRPDHVHDDLSEAVRCVVAARDALIERKRAGAESGGRLACVNAVLSQLVAAEYPLDGIRRQRIEQVRDELAGLPAE